jgi:hypothetical protein
MKKLIFSLILFCVTSSSSSTFSQSLKCIAPVLNLSGERFCEQNFFDSLDLQKIDVTPAPKPSTYLLLLTGLGVVMFVSRRRCLPE